LERLSPEQIHIVHFEDMPVGTEKGRACDLNRLFPGDGMLPLREIVGKLASLGWCGYLSLELFNPLYFAMDPLQVASEGLTRMKAVASEIRLSLLQPSRSAVSR